jgi:hypothetical protein
MPIRRLTADEITSAAAAIHRRLNLGPGDRVILAEMTDEDGNPVVLEVSWKKITRAIIRYLTGRELYAILVSIDRDAKWLADLSQFTK